MGKNKELPTLIVGSGSQARYVIDILTAASRPIAGIAEIEKASRAGEMINGVTIVCFWSDIPKKFSPSKCRIIIGYGNSSKKKEIAEFLSKNGFQFTSAISSHSVISPTGSIGEGSIINPGACVMPNASVGSHAILHSLCTVDHDCVLENYTNLAPGVSLGGRVHVGEGAVLYTGCSVIPDVRIGKWAKVAAGAVVTKDVPDSALVGGVPAKPLN